MGDESQQKDASPDNLDDDLAGDWESAFQADDFSFNPEDGDDDFFLGDDKDYTSATSSPYDFTPPSAEELEDLPDLDEAALEHEEVSDLEAVDETGTIHPKQLPGESLPAQIAAQLVALYHSTRLRLQLLTRIQQITAGAVLLLLLTLPLLIPDSDTKNPDASISAPTNINSLESAINEEPTAPEEAVKEKVRIKWKFPAFLIPAPPRNDTPRKTNFLQTDITLILLLDEGEEPPKEKERMVREIIFQFYSNQPLSEIRRFALARGDMNRALRAWIEKQWPGAPIEAIVFNRYQVI
ncbi:MAG: hypothetical protein OEL55_01220 [Desulfobulbaceae bacterium]|nr:hypothetical protein [Desulfobulbaceae bacterium]